MIPPPDYGEWTRKEVVQRLHAVDFRHIRAYEAPLSSAAILGFAPDAGTFLAAKG